MGAQTEKIKRGVLGCANRVRKGFLLMFEAAMATP